MQIRLVPLQLTEQIFGTTQVFGNGRRISGYLCGKCRSGP